MIAARDRKIGDGHVHPARIVLAGKDELACRRPDPLGDDYRRIAPGAATGEGDVDAGIVLRDARDMVAEPRVDSVAEIVVDQPRDVAATDFQLGGGTPVATLIDAEAGDQLVVAVD